MTDLVLRQHHAVLNPHTGEAIDLAGSDVDLARTLADIRDFESQLREAKQMLTDTLLTRMDADRSWTREAGDYKITGQSDAPKPVYDIEGLLAALDELVGDGVITPDARNRAVEARVEWKVKASGISALLKNPDLARRLEEHISLEPPTQRRVSISRTS